MSEELNIKYIRHKLGVDMLLAKEILKLCSERYIEGIEQGKFDRLMLEQENQQLKERINTYENPEDLTLMFMYCDEKAKDKIKLYKSVLDEIRELLNKTFEYGDEWHWDSGAIRDYLEVIEKLLDKVKE